MHLQTDQQQEPRPDRDLATGDGMSLYALERMLSDISQQPEWRSSSDKCCQYFDGKQLSSDKLAKMDETGEPKTIVNLIQRTVNGALGQEARARLDWMASADTNAFGDLAQALNERMHEAQRETWADMAMSDAYSSQLRAGIGWTEVSRNPDPLGYPYRVQEIHRNEVWWDFRARSRLLTDGKWVCRQRWIDEDEAITALPQFADTIRLGLHSGPLTDAMALSVLSSEKFESLHQTRMSFNRQQEEWLDNSVRKRVRFYDVYYKQPKVLVAMVVGTRRVRFNPQNPVHVAMVQRGMAQLIQGPSYIIRRALFCGPFRLFDVPTRFRNFPLIPWWCYRDDEYGTPYGLVHGMIDPQDEYNERRSRLRWLLRAVQVFVDNDALDEKFNTFKSLALEVMRPDAMFVLKNSRKNSDALKVNRNTELAREQVDVMNDAKQLIQDVPGIYSTMLGNAPSGVTSGLAINSLVEQSLVSLGEVNDNYRMSRRAVGECLSELILEDMAQPNMKIEVGTGKKARVVVLNTFSPEGLPVNHVEDAPVRVGLQDTPSTPAHRQQQQQQLSTAIQGVGNDPIARAVLVPAFIESTDLENRDLYANWMRKKNGVPEPGEADDQREAMEQQMEAMQAQLAEISQQLQLRAATADVEKKEADVQLTLAKAAKEEAQAHVAATPPALPGPDPEELAIADALQEAGAPA